MGGDSEQSDFGADGFGEDMSMDIDVLFDIIGEERDDDPSKNEPLKSNSQIEAILGGGNQGNGECIQGVPQCSSFENTRTDFCEYGAFGQNNAGMMGLSENKLCTSMQFSFVDANMGSRGLTPKDSAFCPSAYVMNDYSAAQHVAVAENPYGYTYNSHGFSMNEELTNYVKSEEGEFLSDSAYSGTKMKSNGHLVSAGRSASRVSTSNYFDRNYEGNDYTSSMKQSLYDSRGCPAEEQAPMQHFGRSPSFIYEDKVKDEKPEVVTGRSLSMWNGVVDDDATDCRYFAEDSRSPFSGLSCSLSAANTQNFIDDKKDVMMADSKVYQSPDCTSGALSPFYSNGNLNMNVGGHYVPYVQPFGSINNQPMSIPSHVAKVSPESSHSNFSEKSVVEDDPDVYIIEDMSHPAPSYQSPVVGNISHPAHSNQYPAAMNTFITSQCSTGTANFMGAGGMKSKAKDERFLLRVLQDISQPKSEMIPPEGLLTVSLLRHQKIALAWMVQKETDGTHCSGGILADDQGLGKTVSTISLILKERSPSCKTSLVQQEKTETLNLDDDDNTPVFNEVKKEADALNVGPHESPTRNNSLALAKGRPAAGTLIVCPTSVLRQWDDELRNKVTSKANLSVLVYHGTNRTKDPCELAKYDVVLTTYSIVNMEVPKQPRADEDDDERGKSEEAGLPEGPSPNKKRKHDSGSDKKRSNSAVYEALARPLAKVGWFRVVLDEAQCIKNHKTQVARACWGLRAKRRWCLSGTPIQNAIDDLYSYFRFLKYDPFDSYKLFRSDIKGPICKSPADGYRKLQTVLKTIMLRRTKGTLLDGEPIINLPPKFVELKKVEFSQEERDFYSKLEADSRAQFEEYAAAGTVKQNYVNILLMLLRLRQACDHPSLVKGVGSCSLWTASVGTASKLPREEQEHLLSCLETSLAICGICNDPPEDAVVAKCGHVFCNQCISEHLTGDDNQCPKANCKAKLNRLSVFSKITLHSCLRDESCQDNSIDCTGPKIVETEASSSECLLFNSSKIKAALGVLQSLCGPQDYLSGNSLTHDTTDEITRNSLTHNVTDEITSPVATGAVEQRDTPKCQESVVGEGLNSSGKAFGQKAIVFSQWTTMLDLLEICLKNSSIKYRRLDGTMSVTARDKAVKDFNTLPEVTVMIMSLKAASLGLNMVVACYVLLLDLWWNPTTEDQAIDRAHRIGQTRPVTVLRLTVKDTVEDRILALQQKKREMVASAFGEDETGGRQTRLTVEDLRYLFMM